MFFNANQNLTITELLEILERIKNAELCRDTTALIKAFSPVWSDLNSDPKLPDDLDKSLVAELYRHAGFLLSYSGQARSLKNYQERAKDLLHYSVRLFEELGLKHKVAEANIMLALCYWYLGEVKEIEAILETVEAEYDNNRLHPVYLQLCINRLLTLYRTEKPPYTKSFEIIEKIKIPMGVCQDNRLQAMYHNQAGVFFNLIKRNDLAEVHHKLAIDFSKKIGSLSFEAINLNNLVLVSNDLGNYDEAIGYADRAMAIFNTEGEPGWIACLLDTKAGVLFKQNKLDEALKTINEALAIFHKGENYFSLTDALFLRARIYFKLGKHEMGIMDFAELISVAKERISGDAVSDYLNQFKKMVYFKTGGNWKSQIADFKKHLIIDALMADDLQVTKAYQTLGLESHQSLSEKLNKQFPEVYEILDMPRPKKKNLAVKIPKTANRDRKSSAKKTYNVIPAPPKPIQLLSIDHTEISFPISPSLVDSSVMCFLVDFQLSPLKNTIQDDIVCLCRPKRSYRNEMILVMDKLSGEFSCAKVHFDKFSSAYLFENFSDGKIETGEDYQVYGQIIGYVPIDEASGARIEFRPFPELSM